MEPNGSAPGIYFRPGDHVRIPGKMQVHERLRFNAEGKPKLQVFSTCQEFIRTIPALPYSLTDPEDIDSDAEDHIYDETRYFCMARPLPTKEDKAKKHRYYDPFEEHLAR